MYLYTYTAVALFIKALHAHILYCNVSIFWTLQNEILSCNIFISFCDVMLPTLHHKSLSKKAKKGLFWSLGFPCLLHTHKHTFTLSLSLSLSLSLFLSLSLSLSLFCLCLLFLSISFALSFSISLSLYLSLSLSLSRTHTHTHTHTHTRFLAFRNHFKANGSCWWCCGWWSAQRLLQCVVAVCCNVLQCVAVCCSVLQCVAVD